MVFCLQSRFQRLLHHTADPNFVNAVFSLHTINSKEQSPLESNSHSVSEEIPPPLMTPYGSLPCSQAPVTGPYPRPDESSPQLSIHFP